MSYETIPLAINLTDVKQFILENNIVSYVVGWAIAVKFTSLIHVVVTDLIMPLLFIALSFVLHLVGLKNNKVFTYILENNQKINLTLVMNEIIATIILFFTVFYIIKHAINSMISRPIITTTNENEQTTTT